MMRPRLRLLMLVSCCLFAAVALAAPRENLVLEEFGSFYVKGKTVRLQGLPKRPRVSADAVADRPLIDPNGEFEAHQIYVQFAKLARPRSRHPIVLWHGGSVSGVTFESTPDGRPGWRSFFLRAGYSIYAVDAYQTGRATWARYPEINREEPSFRSRAFVWETFRIGPPDSYARAEAFAGSRFPVKAFDQLAMQAMPRFAVSEDKVVADFGRVLERVGPSILLVHSASGPFALKLARTRPGLVKALIVVEPSGGIPLDAASAAVLRQIPHLFMWGDNLGSESWSALYESSKDYADALRAAKGDVTWISLPDRGVRGNSHMLMMDDNSDEIAELIVQWLRRRV